MTKADKPHVGRVAGVPNKVNRDIKALANIYTVEALETLAYIMRNGEAEQARVSAARELLDRAHGRAPQAVTGANGAPLFPAITVLFGANAQD